MQFGRNVVYMEVLSLSLVANGLEIPFVSQLTIKIGRKFCLSLSLFGINLIMRLNL